MLLAISIVNLLITSLLIFLITRRTILPAVKQHDSSLAKSPPAQQFKRGPFSKPSGKRKPVVNDDESGWRKEQKLDLQDE
jgi:hypothetical protein